jgi:hypothetical protein
MLSVLVVAVGAGGGACGRLGYELGAVEVESGPGGAREGGGLDLGPPGSGGAATNDAAMVADAVGSGGTGAPADGSSGGAPSNEAAPSSGGADGGGPGGGDASSGGGESDGAVDATDAALPTACANPVAERVWPFHTTVEGWEFVPSSGSGPFAWTSALGQPEPGALALDLQTGTGIVGWILYGAPPPDMRGRTVSGWVYVSGSVDVWIKPFAQSNRGRVYGWVDGGGQTMQPDTWTCVSVDIDAPAYQEDFDPTLVIRIGIEIAGTAPYQVYVDQLAY